MNDIDTLMQRIEEINPKPAVDITATDIDDLIAYHRRNRARKAAGEKVTKAVTNIDHIVKALKPKVKIDIGRRV